MAIKAILKAPLTFFKVAYKHLTKGPPKKTWSFPVYYFVTVLRELMEDNKTSIKSARRYTEVAAPVGWDVKLQKIRIPRRINVNVLELLTPEQLTGAIKAEWIDYKSQKYMKKMEKKQMKQNSEKCCRKCGRKVKTKTPLEMSGPNSPVNFPGNVSDTLVQPSNTKETLLKPTEQIALDKVILYLHGGAYIVCSPKTHRWLTWRLARNANARILAIYYRRAPEYTFPCALHDAISAYMHLIDPPAASGAHRYEPHQIALAGDSAGGNLALALSLWLKRNGVPLPGSAALFSPWVDLTHSMPSYRLNAPFDYLPANVGDPKWLPRHSELCLDQWRSASASKKSADSDVQIVSPSTLVAEPSSSKAAVELPGVTAAATESSVKAKSLVVETAAESAVLELSSEEENEDFFHLVGTRTVNVDELALPLIHNSQYYAPDFLLKHPYISPLFGKPSEWQQVFKQMNTLVLAGDAERLRDESVALLGRAAGAVRGDSLIEEPIVSCDRELDASLKNNFRVELYEDGIHVVPLLFKTNLSRVCLLRAGQFLNSHLHYGKEVSNDATFFLSKVTRKNIVTEMSLVDAVKNMAALDSQRPPDISIEPPTPVLETASHTPS